MNLIWQCWLLVWTTGEGCYMQDGFYWWLCRSLNLQVQVCEWHYHASQVEWALRICAYAHMHMWVYALRWRRTYQSLPSGEMYGEGCRMKERTMTVETEPLLACIFGWWAMFLLFFPNWVLLWWLAVLRASYEFAWLAASKERNKIGILNLFLLVSWTTMSYYYFPSAVLVDDDDFGVWRLWCVSWLPNESFAEGEEYEHELASEPLLAPDHFYDRWSSPVMDFPSEVYSKQLAWQWVFAAIFYRRKTEFVWQFGNPMMVSNADRHWLEGSVWVRSQVTAGSTWQWHVETEHGQTRGSTSDLRSPPIVLRSMKSCVRIWYRWCALSDGWWLEIARYYNILICVLLMLSTIDLCLIVCTMVDGHIMAPPDSETGK